MIEIINIKMDGVEVERQQTFQKIPQSEQGNKRYNEPSNQIHQQHIQSENRQKGFYIFLLPFLILVIGVLCFVNLKAELRENSKVLADITVDNLGAKADGIRKKISEQAKDIDEYQNQSIAIVQKMKLESKLMYDNTKEINDNQRIKKTRDLADKDKYLINNENAKASFLNSLKNIKLAHQNIHFQRQIQQKQQQLEKRLNTLYKLAIPQRSFCVIVPTKGSRWKFRYQYVLQSIFIQDYTNYKVIIIDDSPDTQTLQLFQQYAKENPIKQPISYVLSKDRGNTLEHIYTAVTEHCSPQDNAIVLEESGELLGRYVLKVFNSVYSQSKAEALYSNSLIYDITKNSISPGQSSAYTEEEKTNNSYRYELTKMGPLRSFKVKTFLKIPITDLQDKDGQFIREGYEQVLYPQILELSCEKNQFIDEFAYLIEVQSGKKERTPQETREKAANQLRTRKRHTCKK